MVQHKKKGKIKGCFVFILSFVFVFGFREREKKRGFWFLRCCFVLFNFDL